MTELSIQHTSRAMIMIYQRSIISGLLSNCLTGLVGSQFDEGLRHQWPLPSTEIWIWHITPQLLDRTSVPTLKKMKNPRRATGKTPESPRSNFYAMGDSVEMAAVDVARLYCGLNRYFRYRCFLLRGDCLHTYIDTKLVKVWRIRKSLQRIAAYQTLKGKEATRFLKMSI